MSSRLAVITIITFITLVSPLCAHAAKPRQRDIHSVKREQKAVADEMRQTGKALSDNSRATERNLNLLNLLQRRMAESREAIAASQKGIDSLDTAIRRQGDSLAVLTARLAALRKSYADALRRQQLYPDVSSPITFIFSASSVNDAYRRMRYLRQFDRWRSKRTAELTKTAQRVESARTRLEEARAERAGALTRLTRQRDGLAREQASTDSLVKALRKEGAGLKAVLAEKQRRADALDRELDRLIAEEQARAEAARRAKEEEEKARRKKAAAESAPKHDAPPATPGKATPPPAPSSYAESERKLTGSFAANKGRLLFPVAGRYRIVRGFGLQNHPELKHVKTNNSGIDIEVAPGTDARAIFDGHVSGIFRLPGYANIIMVRHGEYISLYANLAKVYVAKGQTVKTGQPLGLILTGSDEDGGATTFHFELRRERAKLNPLEWVK